MKTKKAIGFISWATYELKDKACINKAICALARFTEYTNIEENRMGVFGTIRVVLRS